MIEKYGQAVVPVLVEPIFRRQPEEGDREYRFFLAYRDIPWEDRTLRNATLQIMGKVSEEAAPLISEFSARWQWERRADAYDLFIQEERSSKNERLVQETKSEIEMLVYKLVKKIRSIQIATDKIESGSLTPEIMRDLLLLEGLLGKGNAGKFLLEAYKTIVGEKLQISGKVSHLVWGS